MMKRLGKPLTADRFKDHFDFAFLCLHGPFGEDGKIQGLLEYHGVPYSGSGILPSAIGIDKPVQKKLMKAAGFPSPKFIIIRREEFIGGNLDHVYERAAKEISAKPA
jgi:D-alanine-D-alanine ligase